MFGGLDFGLKNESSCRCFEYLEVKYEIYCIGMSAIIRKWKKFHWSRVLGMGLNKRPSSGSGLGIVLILVSMEVETGTGEH